MNIQYDEKIKKRLIALLLLVSCIISILILINTPAPSRKSLENFAQADSLIESNLNRFNITDSQIRISRIKIDSNLTRKTYYIDVPPGFSKTLLHAELNRTFHPLSVETPAKVFLPEADMLIHITYGGTVFRSLSLRIDPSLQLNRRYASIMVAFDSAPPDAYINDIISFGEPISIVLRVSDAREAEKLRLGIRDRYSLFSFWLTSAEGENNGNPSFLPPLHSIREFESGARILSFKNPNSSGSPSAAQLEQIASENGVSFIDVSDAQILGTQLGESVFKQELSKFEQKAHNKEAPVAIVMADEEALDWLREEVTEFKKGGLYLVPPPEINF